MGIRFRLIAATFAAVMALSVLGGGSAFAASGNANPNAENGQEHASANCEDTLARQAENEVSPPGGEHEGTQPSNCDHNFAGP
jgi:hypothetical protein